MNHKHRCFVWLRGGGYAEEIRLMERISGGSHNKMEYMVEVGWKTESRRTFDCKASGVAVDTPNGT